MGSPHIQAFVIPKIDVSTDTTTFISLTGEQVNGGDAINLMPWSGVVQRVLVGYNTAIGDGFVQVNRWPGGIVDSEIEGDQFPYTSGAPPDILEFNVNVPFNKDDGLFLGFQGDGVSDVALRVTFQVEFAFV